MLRYSLESDLIVLEKFLSLLRWREERKKKLKKKKKGNLTTQNLGRGEKRHGEFCANVNAISYPFWSDTISTSLSLHPGQGTP